MTKLLFMSAKHKPMLQSLPQYSPMQGVSGGNEQVTQISDEAIIATRLCAQIGNGEREAEQALVVRYTKPLLFMLRRRCRDPELADDLHQDVFRIVIERLRDRGINEPAKLGGFIQSTGRNLLIGVIRRRQRRQTYADSDTVNATADSDAEQQFANTHAQQTAEQVRTFLDALGSERDRAILWRFYLQQEDKSTICVDLELSELHFNRVLYRAKKRFRALLESSDSDIALDLIAGRRSD